MTHYAISLDDFVEQVHEYLSENQDGPAAHYACYEANNKKAAVLRVLEELKPFIVAQVYKSDAYGYRLSDKEPRP